MDSWYLPSRGLPAGLAAVTSFVQLFVKVAPSSQLNDDLAVLRLKRAQLLTASVHIGRSRTGVSVHLDSSAGLELRLTSPATPGVEWRLRYADSWVSASARVLEEARQRGEEEAWKQARKISAVKRDRGPFTSPKPWGVWTDAEVEELMKEDTLPSDQGA